jgi:hypothetical protein
MICGHLHDAFFGMPRIFQGLILIYIIITINIFVFDFPKRRISNAITQGLYFAIKSDEVRNHFLNIVRVTTAFFYKEFGDSFRGPVIN